LQHIVNGVQIDPKRMAAMALQRFLELPKYTDEIDYSTSIKRATELMIKRRKKFEAAVKNKK